MLLPRRCAAGSLGSVSYLCTREVTVGFGDKFKDLRKQAQDAVAGNRDKIHDAVDVVSTTVDQKTGGKHTAKIAKFGEQAGAAVDRFSETDDSGSGSGSGSGESGAAEGSAPAGAPAPPPPASGEAKAPETGERFGGPPPAFDE
jgi:hypothetical protein